MLVIQEHIIESHQQRTSFSSPSSTKFLGIINGYVIDHVSIFNCYFIDWAMIRVGGVATRINIWSNLHLACLHSNVHEIKPLDYYYMHLILL